MNLPQSGANGAGGAGDAPSDAALSAQLFRYAQDLDVLMQQYDRLQRHQQMILQSLGQDIHSENLMSELLADAVPRHWITDTQGVLLQCVHGTHEAPPGTAGPWVGQPLQDLLAPALQEPIAALLQHLERHGPRGSAVQLRLELGAAAGEDLGLHWDAVLMQQQSHGRFELHWFLLPAPPGPHDALQALARLVQAVKPSHGLVLTNPHGSVVAVNSEYCRASGYSEAELLGGNPRMLNSGRHDTSFFQDFWYTLLDSGRWSGTLFNRRRQGQIYLQWQTVHMVEDMDGAVLAYMAASADLSYTEPTLKRLQDFAYTDALTGLPNRRMLAEQLQQKLKQAQEQSQPLAVLFIDLDRFKPINDEMGHAVGDRVLQQVAARMRDALQSGDLLARVGGDEFVVVLCGEARVALAEAIGLHLHGAIRPPMQIQDCQLELSASIGCARFPQDAMDQESLMRCADAAMYGAKRFGIPLCNYDLGLATQEQPNLERDLWRALERGEISLVYQPQIDQQRGLALRGCEALMRWAHPQYGSIEPGIFIALAEKSGAIVPMGNWALAHACDQLKHWSQQGLQGFTLSLNVSLRQLRQPGFAETVRQELQKNGLQPEQLEMEISETQAMLFAPGDTEHIQTLRQIGVRIAIDDYGISFSRMSRLNLLSISSFKLNPQCVQDLTTSADARAISRCMITIGRAMGIEVIAQGVETPEQAAVLVLQGCHVMQGFHTGRPMAAAELLALALENRSKTACASF